MLKLAHRFHLVVVLSFLTVTTATAMGRTQARDEPSKADRPLVINVTAGSAPGWVPSPEQQAAALETATRFLTLLDHGDSRQAYAQLTELNRSGMPYADFADSVVDFNRQAGAVLERRFVMTTWTKDSPDAPIPGVYAAIDLTSRFAEIDRHCGYLILYQAPAGGPFRVMRQESTFLTNAAAKQKSKAEVDAVWAQVSANCPNYAASEAELPLAEQASDIGYPTVAAALAGLHARADVEFSTSQGWTVANDKAAMTLWSFPPPDHPAYPAAVKRQVVQDGDAVSLKMSVHCEADKVSCDALVRSFQQLNAQIR